jgi:hypothetical protein
MVGPLDSQIVINQSAATEKVQKHFALRLQEEQERRQRDIVDTEMLDQVVIRNREKREEKQKGRRKSRRKASSEDETAQCETHNGENTGARVDIFV